MILLLSLSVLASAEEISIDWFAIPETITPDHEREARLAWGPLGQMTRVSLGAAHPLSDRTAHAVDGSGVLRVAWTDPAANVVLAAPGEAPAIVSALPEQAPQGPALDFFPTVDSSEHVAFVVDESQGWWNPGPRLDVVVDEMGEYELGSDLGVHGYPGKLLDIDIQVAGDELGRAVVVRPVEDRRGRVGAGLWAVFESIHGWPDALWVPIVEGLSQDGIPCDSVGSVRLALDHSEKLHVIFSCHEDGLQAANTWWYAWGNEDGFAVEKIGPYLSSEGPLVHQEVPHDLRGGIFVDNLNRVHLTWSTVHYDSMGVARYRLMHREEEEVRLVHESPNPIGDSDVGVAQHVVISWHEPIGRELWVGRGGVKALVSQGDVVRMGDLVVR